ncbi:hypothetical protein [Kribbella sp. NPDC023855]|uniref:hypothetical protein n=1 Tax=Kribbella sp. NPDC023855 TaxID=3154698 RepID=UPI0033F0A258
MGTTGYLLLLLLAVVLSAQTFLLMGRRKPLDKRLRDLGNDSFGLLSIVLLLGGTLGALLGHLANHVPAGTAAGLATGFLTWIVAVIRAHTKPSPPPRHRENV